MSEASSYSTDIAKMRNALLSSVSSRLHCYGIGKDEVQLEFLEGSMQMNDLTNFHCNGFNNESRIFKDDSQMGEGVNTQPSQSQSLIYDHNHQQGSLYAIPSIKDIYHHSLLLEKDPSSQYERVPPQELGDKLQIDPRSRGLCLVPVSVTEKVKMVDQIHLSSASSNIIYS